MSARSYLVRTEAGLRIHSADTRPALADDREYVQPEPIEIEMRVMIGRLNATPTPRAELAGFVAGMRLED
jgi:hypothetical protein